MNKKIYFLGNSFKVIVALLSCLFLFNQKSYAAEEGVSSAGFTFNTNYPENQISDSGYLNLLMIPGQKETISLTLTNTLDEEVNVDLNIAGAKTNKNGVIEYSADDIQNDDSLKYPFEKLVSGPKEVTLAPKETKNVEFDISMPENEFDGRIVGGISMVRSAKDDKKENTEGTQIINRFRYIAPVVLQTNKNEVEPKLELKKVYAEQLNSKNTIYVEYSNIEPTFLDNMSVEVNITKKGKDTVLYETKKTNMRMAPNTMISFPVSMQGEEMVPGEYTAKILVKGDNNINENWTKDFTITKTEADKYNERDTGLYEEKTTDWKLIVLIVIGSLILITIVYIVISKINKAKQEKKEQAMRKKKRAKLKK